MLVCSIPFISFFIFSGVPFIILSFFQFRFSFYTFLLLILSECVMVLLYNLKNKRFVPARNVVSKEREDEQEIHMLFYQFFLTKKLDLNDYNISPNLSLFTRDTLVM